MLAMKNDHTTTARLDVLQAAIEAMFEGLAPNSAAAVRAGLSQRLDDLDACQPDADAARAGVAAALLAVLGPSARTDAGGSAMSTATRAQTWTQSDAPTWCQLPSSNELEHSPSPF